MIKREKYLSILRETRDKDYIKLLVGVRRSGKSTILRLFSDELISSGISAKQIVSINYEMIENDYLKNGEQLHKYIKSLNIQHKIYLFLDEVQEINDWARVVNSLRVSFNIDIYVTGSNARMFIGEHLTYLSGRYLKVDVYPLSLEEIKIFSRSLNSPIQTYQIFLESSFPSVVLETSDKIKKMLQQDIFDAIFTRDILLRGKVSLETTFYQIARYVLEHIGSNISINKIKNTLTTEGIKVSFDTVEKYIDLMIKSYFLHECLRFDIKGKTALKSNHKYYVVDLGIRNQLVPIKNSNTGRILENTVYLELLKKGYKVYTGIVNRDLEIDFVAIKDDKTIYVQVCETILDENTRKREERPFTYIEDRYPRYLVTLDDYKFHSDQYEHLNLFQFIEII